MSRYSGSCALSRPAGGNALAVDDVSRVSGALNTAYGGRLRVTTDGGSSRSLPTR
jgi:hypothetical protein